MQDQSWDSYWKSTDQSFLEKQIQRYKASHGYTKLINAVPDLGRLGSSLEVGAGKGWISRNLKQRGWEVYGIDINQQVALQNHRFINGYIIGDMFRLPFRDHSFDLVMSCGLLEHFESETVIEIVSEMRRVGQRVANWLPTCTASWQLLWKVRNSLGGDVYTESYVHTVPKLRSLFKESGFQHVTVRKIKYAAILEYLFVYAY